MTPSSKSLIRTVLSKLSKPVITSHIKSWVKGLGVSTDSIASAIDCASKNLQSQVNISHL